MIKWAALALVSLIFGSNYLVIRIIAAHVPPLLFQGIRFTLAGLIVFLLAAYRGSLRERPTAKQWRTSIYIGGVMLMFGQGGVAWSEQYIPSGMAALIVATIPLWVVILSRFALGVEFRVQTAAGLVLGFVGLLPIVHLGAAGAGDTIAIVVLLLAALGWAVGSVYSKRAQLHTSSAVAISMQMICGGIGLIMSSLLGGEWRHVSASAFNTQILAALLYLTLVGGVVAYIAFGWLVRNAPPAMTAMFAYISPIVAVALGHFVLAEPVTFGTIAGGCIILSGVALVMTERKRRTAPLA